MTINGVTSLSLAHSLLVLSLCLSFLTMMTFSAPTLADYPLQSHRTEWKTLPTGQRVSCPEKMRQSRTEGWRRSTTEARVHQWREEFDVIASSRGRRLLSSTPP